LTTTIPSTIKIGMLPFAVEEVNSSEMTDCSDQQSGWQVFGDIQYSKQLIRITNDSSPEFQRHILIHEIMHGIAHLNGLAQDEGFINTISHALYDLIVNNPDLIRYIRG